MPVSTPSRPQPPSITDPEAGEFDQFIIRVPEEQEASGMVQDSDRDEKEDRPDWMKRARDAFRFSTTYVDSNYRKQWEDSLRAFNNLHPGESKYNSEQFRKRSTLFRPKTRSITRKNEAAAAAAFFSNVDRVSMEAVNQSDPKQRISAAVMKELIQYRLTKTIPWFQILVGGLQDGQVQGVAAAHIHWRYVQKRTKDGDYEKVEDQPHIDLIPVENLRIDPASSWLDPVNTSPYLIHLFPMYVVDVKERMRKPDPKGRRWRHLDDAVFSSYKTELDSTRQARSGVSQEPTSQQRTVSDYDVVWIHRHIHRYAGEDYEFYTLASERMLTEPEPLADVVFHGLRPYVMGVPILETHKPFPTSLPKLVSGLQEEANNIANQRMDNVSFVLNKRWFAKRGKNVDLASLVRNVPGGITLLDDPEADVKEVTWPDVTASAYLEQDRIDSDFSDLAGNFDPMQVQALKLGQASENTMRMLQGPTNLLTEYMLKTYVETFVQPVLRHLVLLEQHYETDAVLLGLAGDKAQVFQKYGVEKVTDDLIEGELTVTVNVGMGATDPVMKLQRFVFGMHALQQFALKPPPGINIQEFAKEIFGLSGYQDGLRFFMDDPDKAHATQLISALQMKLREFASKVKEKELTGPVKLEIARMNNETKLRIADKAQDKESRHLLTSHLMDMEKNQQTAALTPPPASKAPPEGSKKAMTAEMSATLKQMAQKQEQFAQALTVLAQAMHQQMTKEPKPRKRVGKARLPSGGEMVFEMSDSEH
jgi:hypothetical protein